MWIIAGQYRKRRLLSPSGEQTRPTASQLREAVFNICQSQARGAHFLDLFAGSGAMGLEALSRGALSATFVEHHPHALRCIRENIATLGVAAQAKIVPGHVEGCLSMLWRQGKSFDIIYADPPYAKCSNENNSHVAHLIQWLDRHPLLVPGGLLFVEESADVASISQDLQQLVLRSSRRIGAARLTLYEYCSSIC